jgi:hypothetical protein
MVEAQTIELPAAPVHAAMALLRYFGVGDDAEVEVHQAPRLEGRALGPVLEVRQAGVPSRLYLLSDDWMGALLADLCA